MQGISLRKEPQLKADVYNWMSYDIYDILAGTCPHLCVPAIIMLNFSMSSSLFRFNYHIYTYIYIYIYKRNTGLEQNAKLKEDMYEQERRGKFSSSVTGLSE